MDKNKPKEDENDLNVDPITQTHLLDAQDRIKTSLDKNKPREDENDLNVHPMTQMNLLDAQDWLKTLIGQE